jgi:hypothetical protein
MKFESYKRKMMQFFLMNRALKKIQKKMWAILNEEKLQWIWIFVIEFFLWSIKNDNILVSKCLYIFLNFSHSKNMLVYEFMYWLSNGIHINCVRKVSSINISFINFIMSWSIKRSTFVDWCWDLISLLFFPLVTIEIVLEV